MLKNFLLKRMLKSKMKDVPEAQQEQILKLLQEHPEFFQKIAVEIQQKMKEGKDQMAATMEVMQSHQGELQKLMGK